MEVRRGRVIWAVVVAVVALLAASLVVVRMQPAVTDVEVGDAVAAVARLGDEQRALGCARPPLHGPVTPGSGTARFARLVDRTGPFTDCLAIDRAAVFDELMGTPGGYRWNLEDVPLNTTARLADDWSWPQFSRPPYPEDRIPAETQSLLRMCEGVPGAVQAIVSHEEVCSPWHDPPPDIPDVGDLVPLMSLASAVSVSARRLAAAGDGNGALALLLDGMQLMSDAHRGNVPILQAMVAVAAIDVLLGGAQVVLALELGLTDDEIDEHRRRIDLLVSSYPAPLGMLRGELSWLPRGYPLTDSAGRMQLVALVDLYGDTEQDCAAGTTAAGCLTNLRFIIGPVDNTYRPPEWAGTLLGPRFTRLVAMRSIRDMTVHSWEGYVRRSYVTQTRITALKAILGFHARRRDGSCPGVAGFDPADLEAPELGAPLTVVEASDGQIFEVHAPPILGRPGAGPGLRPLLMTICPGLTVDRAGVFPDAEVVDDN